MSTIDAGQVILDAPHAMRTKSLSGVMGMMRGVLGTLSLLLVFLSVDGRAAEVIPPAPPNHFNDYARAVGSDTARQLNAELAQFERDTSNQILVVIYPHMQSDSSIEDYTVRVKQAWGVGRKDRDNGAVLFIFSQDRKLYIQVGYGLEGALPDALCKRIVENEITPRFRAGDFNGGVSAGTRALIAAARGEYTGSGRTAAEARQRTGGGVGNFVFLILAFVIFGGFSRFFRRNTVYSRRGHFTPWISTGSSGGWGGGGGGGGGSFSGGGGGGGGGGAGGSW